MPAFWALKGIVPHSKKEKLTPGIEIKENPVFGFWDCFMERTVNLPVPGIKTVVAGHLEILFRDMLNQKFNEVNGRKGPLNERVIFVPIIMESHPLPIVGIDSGKSNDGTAKIAADIFNNGFGVAEIRLCINVKSIFVLMVNVSFYLFERGANALFQFI